MSKEICIKGFRRMLGDALASLKDYKITADLRKELKTFLHNQLPDDVLFKVEGCDSEFCVNSSLVEIRVDYDYRNNTIKSIKTYLKE